MLAIVAAALGIPATTQAWTAGTDDVGALVVQNDVPADGDLFRIGFIGGDYEIGGITENAHVFGNCAATSEPNVVHCSPTGITHVAIIGSGESGDHDSFLLDRAWDLTSARLPDGVTTTIHLSRGSDGVIGSHNRDVIFGGAHSDFLQGQGGHDKLVGQSGKDDLFGAAGQDLLLAQDGMGDGTIDCGPGLDPPALFDVGLDPAPVDCG